MNLQTIFRYLINFLLAVFILFILYCYYTDNISSLWTWVNILGGIFVRTVFVELMNQNEE
ncbi:hypothetical protein BU607_03515 [Staphylococcus auricularis]|uniref:Phage protein n=1 Tax=Staphylococcus auricularis TaxID=29379 RepID=A0ABX5IH15_9STAP|nr:hypothetical protein BU607_03515 [Staphylococcus auricularis]PTH27087.1 hypothetical protein BU608_02840 [Staphylococcus auricularis]